MNSQTISSVMIVVLSILAGSAVENNYRLPPKTDTMLFYIQRNRNSNTVIYDAIFDSRGRLLKTKPIDVYWLRYQEDGQRKELRAIEKRFAYGVECMQIEGLENQYEVELVAYHKRKFRLVQVAPFKAIAITTINNRESQLDHLYVSSDYSGFWPKVQYIDFFGFDVKTGEVSYERVRLD